MGNRTVRCKKKPSNCPFLFFTKKEIDEHKPRTRIDHSTHIQPISFLDAAINSIQTQTLQNGEWIIVDDGSTDDTVEKLATLVRNLEQPGKIIRHENRGAYGARSTDPDNANGSYIAFFDSDDK